jgi:23S rRNA U2552 (ribose-2'-O)-methylase RlmE/FtsJ
MLHDFNINCNGDSLSLAESPGGFIQAIDDYRLIKRIKNCMCYTISLTSESEIYDIPRFHKNIIRNKNVEIFNFLEGNGDLLQLSTFLNIQKKLKNSKIILVTADGGINDHGEFNNKELNHINLIFCEFINAVFVLENGGTFIVKIFDIFTDAMIHLIRLITYLFGDTKITKPLTSRSTNSEKYVVCSNFKKNKLTINLRNNLVKLMWYIHQEKKIITSLFDIAPGEFLNKIINYNTVTVKNQIINIEKILEYIKSDKKKYNDFSRVKDTLVRNWLVKYKLIQK